MLKLIKQCSIIIGRYQIRSDDWVEALPSQRRLQFICSYVILLLLRVSTILFVLSSFHVVLFSI